MSEILKQPELVDYRMDEKMCRVITDSDIEEMIKEEFRDELANDHLYKVKIAYIEDRNFYVLKSLLEPLPEIVSVEE